MWVEVYLLAHNFENAMKKFMNVEEKDCKSDECKSGLEKKSVRTEGEERRKLYALPLITPD